MADQRKQSISIDPALYARLERLARQRGVSLMQLLAEALAAFLSGEAQPEAVQQTDGQPPIRQGAVYWLSLDAAGIAHPHVVIQEDVLNHSRLSTTIVCALTTNLRRAQLPGNVLLEAGEANLPRQSVVEVSKVSAVEKTRLGAYIGTLDRGRVEQILAGMQFIAFFTEHPHVTERANDADSNEEGEDD